MIYTVTFNPSLDYSVFVKDIKKGETNRSYAESILHGGKGINVSAMLKNFGIQSTVLGFTAGFTGDEIERRVKASGCISGFIHLESGLSRINIKIKSDEETEINSRGADIPPEKLSEFLERFDNVEKGDIIVLAGSIPPSLPDTIYKDIMKMLEGRGIMIIVDASKNLLLNVIENRPFLIKPNNYELGEIFGENIGGKDIEKIVRYAGILHDRGAQNVLISLAGDGAVLVSADGSVYMSDAPKGKVINSVGAGDSMVAGFIAGWTQKQDYEHAFKMGISAGSASAFSEYFAEPEQVKKIYESLTVKII